MIAGRPLLEAVLLDDDHALREVLRASPPNISYLFQKKHGSEPPLRNVPNKYLLDDRVFPPRT